jgi:ribosomal protein S7
VPYAFINFAFLRLFSEREREREEKSKITLTTKRMCQVMIQTKNYSPHAIKSTSFEEIKENHADD